jgi:hypothetical protein
MCSVKTRSSGSWAQSLRALADAFAATPSTNHSVALLIVKASVNYFYSMH